MKIRVMLVEDHCLLRETLRMFLEREPDIDVVGEASDGRGAIWLAREHSPDVAVLDITMTSTNGIATAARLVARYPQLRVIALSAHADCRYVLEMLQAGAVGYVTKAADGAELLRAIRAVAKGQSHLSPEATVGLLNAVTQREGNNTSGLALLGRRECEVLQLTSEGHRTRAIATLLAISMTTVDTHRRNIMRKLGVHSTAELTKYAIREGLTVL